jgi:hypothetical protein
VRECAECGVKLNPEEFESIGWDFSDETTLCPWCDSGEGDDSGGESGC